MIPRHLLKYSTSNFNENLHSPLPLSYRSATTVPLSSCGSLRSDDPVTPCFFVTRYTKAYSPAHPPVVGLHAGA